MLKKPNSLKFAVASFFATLTLIGPVSSVAAPGTLSDSPMFLTNPVEPNILFMVDDSRSMDWGVMTNEDSGIIFLACDYYYVHLAADNNYFWVVPSEAGLIAQGVAAPYSGVWRGWNSHYNKVYYDPTTSYMPWPGENASGNLYSNSNPLAAPIDPYVTGGDTVNLTEVTTYDTDYCPAGLGRFTVNNFFPARYQQWKDSNSDGVVDVDDAHALVEIRPTTLIYPGGPNRRDCAAAPLCTY